MFLFNRSNANFKQISIDDYRSQFKSRKDHHLIDVREPSEFRRGHLPGAVNIPLSEIAKRDDEIPNDMPIVLVCATGNRSNMAARSLAKAGYEDLYNLQGGTMTWMRKGLKVQK